MAKICGARTRSGGKCKRRSTYTDDDGRARCASHSDHPDAVEGRKNQKRAAAKMQRQRRAPTKKAAALVETPPGIGSLDGLIITDSVEGCIDSIGHVVDAFTAGEIMSADAKSLRQLIRVAADALRTDREQASVVVPPITFRVGGRARARPRRRAAKKKQARAKAKAKAAGLATLVGRLPNTTTAECQTSIAAITDALIAGRIYTADAETLRQLIRLSVDCIRLRGPTTPDAPPEVLFVVDDGTDPLTTTTTRTIPMMQWQYDALTSTADNIVCPAGLGSGKTTLAVHWCIAAAARHAGPPEMEVCGAVVEPTFAKIGDTWMPELRRALAAWGMQEGTHWRHNKSKNEITLRFAVDRVCTIYLRGGERDDAMVGINACFVIFDEAGFIRQSIWDKAPGRLRGHSSSSWPRQFLVVGTPEGFNTFYEYAEKPAVVDEGDGVTTTTDVFRACTLDNRHLKPTAAAYVSVRLGHYTETEREAYVYGRFVTRNGRVFEFFDEAIHVEECIDPLSAREIIMGVDFGSSRAAFLFGCVYRDDDGNEVLHWFDEYISSRTGTLAACQEIRKRWDSVAYRYDAHESWDDISANITAYCDASPWQRTDRDVLAAELGVRIHAGKNNPRIMDRVHAVNRRLMNRLILVDGERCPNIVRSMRNHAYAKNGLPEEYPHDDGSQDIPGLEHASDALGYPVAYRWPVASDAPTNRRAHVVHMG